MLKLHNLRDYEHFYFFEDVVAEVDVLNGCIGEVTDGIFKPAAGGTRGIMQIEVGDDMGMDKYVIPAGTRLRSVRLDKMAELERPIEVYGAQLPKEFKVGDKLASDEAGVLVAGAEGAPYLEVVEIIGNKAGIVAKIVMA